MYYTKEELAEAKRQIDSTIHKLQQTLKTLQSKEKAEKCQSQITRCPAPGQSVYDCKRFDCKRSRTPN